MEKSYRGVLIFLGIAILIAGGWIGGGLSDIADSMNQQYDDSFDGDDSFDDGDYEIFVQDKVIYLYDKSSAQIWKKEDKPNTKWEEVEYVFDE